MEMCNVFNLWQIKSWFFKKLYVTLWVNWIQKHSRTGSVNVDVTSHIEPVYYCSVLAAFGNDNGPAFKYQNLKKKIHSLSWLLLIMSKLL